MLDEDWLGGGKGINMFGVVHYQDGKESKKIESA